MANAKNIAETTVTNTTSEAKVLTVVVLDDKNVPTEGARVSIKPSDASNTTNSVGEAQFTLGSATKYDITASYGSKTVTVPYYVTKDGATKLIVNPTYVRSIENKLHPSLISSQFLLYSGIGLGIIIVLFCIWKFFIKKKK